MRPWERGLPGYNYWTVIETWRKYSLELGKKLRGRWTTKLQVAFPELIGISMSHPRTSPPGPQLSHDETIPEPEETQMYSCKVCTASWVCSPGHNGKSSHKFSCKAHSVSRTSPPPDQAVYSRWMVSYDWSVPVINASHWLLRGCQLTLELLTDHQSGLQTSPPSWALGANIHWPSKWMLSRTFKYNLSAENFYSVKMWQIKGQSSQQLSARDLFECVT